MKKSDKIFILKAQASFLFFDILCWLFTREQWEDLRADSMKNVRSVRALIRIKDVHMDARGDKEAVAGGNVALTPRLIIFLIIIGTVSAVFSVWMAAQ